MVAADVHHHQRLQLRQEEEEEEEEEVDFEVSSDISDDSEETPHEHEGEEEDELGDHHHHHLLLQAPASKIRLKSPPPGSKVAQLKDTIEAQVGEKQKQKKKIPPIVSRVVEFSSCDPEGRTRLPQPEESTRWRTRRRRKAIGV